MKACTNRVLLPRIIFTDFHGLSTKFSEIFIKQLNLQIYCMCQCVKCFCSLQLRLKSNLLETKF